MVLTYIAGQLAETLLDTAADLIQTSIYILYVNIISILCNILSIIITHLVRHKSFKVEFYLYHWNPTVNMD